MSAKEENAPLSPQQQKRQNLIKLTLAAIIMVAVVYRLGWDTMANILLVLAGFGAVIFVHELGHFLAAKAVGIKVEGFCLGFNPLLFGVTRAEGGWQVRILPEILPSSDGLGSLAIKIPHRGLRAGETEYRLGLIPLGGYVKMLGQEDTSADKPSADPRAFGNKPIWQRMIVISAGVIMNVVIGAIVFMVVFAHGKELPPAIVGYVEPASPAYIAGLRGGDEVISINGNTDVDYMELIIAAAFADKGEKVALTVKRPNGDIKTIAVEPAQPKTEFQQAKYKGVKYFGIGLPNTLKLFEFKVDDPNHPLTKLGFAGGDEITAVDGKPISRYDQLHDALYPQPGVIAPASHTVTVKRIDEKKQFSYHDITIPMAIGPVDDDLFGGQVMGMVPRQRIDTVSPETPATRAGVQTGDIVARFGTVANPTLMEIREQCLPQQPCDMLVLRKGEKGLEEKTLQVTPAMPTGTPWWHRFLKKTRPVIGVVMVPDLQQPVVANVRLVDMQMPDVRIPRGATLTAINGSAVNSWAEVVTQLIPLAGKTVTIDYLNPLDNTPTKMEVTIPADNPHWLGFSWQADLGNLAGLPLKPLTRLYRGHSMIENMQMGFNRTKSFIAQTYLMLRGMIVGTVPASAASGPVGILRITYTIAKDRSLIDYCYFLAIISISVAVINFLPLPVLDGGYVIMLLIEKIKGSPVPLKIQEVITYAGLGFLLLFVLFITFHDILKIITGQL